MHSSAQIGSLTGLLLLVACTPPGEGVRPQTAGTTLTEKGAAQPPSSDASKPAPAAEPPSNPAASTSGIDSGPAPTQDRADASKAPPESEEDAKQTEEAASPRLTDDEGKPLPQTDEKPALDSARFQKDARLLFDAIVKDDATLAERFFFPKIAYEQVKNIPNPAGDWEARLFSAYEKDIHAYHQALGKHREEASFEEFRVAEQLARWVKPGEEVNKEGYFRVMRSVLVYRDHEGRKRELGLRTMISWRGEWYVVHLK